MWNSQVKRFNLYTCLPEKVFQTFAGFLHFAANNKSVSQSVRPVRLAAKFLFYTDVAKIQETIQNLGNHAHWLRINICNLSECEESLLRTAFPWRKNDTKQSIKNRGKVANIKYEFANHLWRRFVGPPAMHLASKFEQIGLRPEVRIPKRQPSLGREPVRKQVWKKNTATL